MHFCRSFDGVRIWMLLTIAKPGFVFFVIILRFIFDDFERFLHPWREQSNTGNDKNNAFLWFFAGRSTACVFYHCKTELRIFCGNFVVNFRRFWSIFSSIAWAKQHRERQKLTRFDAFPQVKRRHAFLIIAISIFTIFRDHFAMILDAF